MKYIFPITIAALLCLAGCGNGSPKVEEKKINMDEKTNEFAEVTLSADLSGLTKNEHRMLPFLLEAARSMDDIFWKEAFGDKAKIESIEKEETRDFACVNYGVWDRLDNNKPFVEGYGAKPLGANFYPHDMTKEEFAAFQDPLKTAPYTVIRRDSANKLTAIPYHVYFQEEIGRAVNYIKLAIAHCDNKELKKYLYLRTQALLSDDYRASDLAWMDMRTNRIDFVVGPIESYEDALYGYKTSHEAFLLLKDEEWTKKLEHLNKLMPQLQKSLPCAPEYKKESPGGNSDLGVYQALYYAGDCNAGSKTIAINLPNDEQVQLQKGTRKLQLKNSMQAKFDKILLPIAQLVIDKSQLQNVKFDAFFENVMYHEVAHGLGIKETVNKKGTVRNALKETYSTIEEAKADIAGVFLVKQLTKKGILTDKDLMDNYVTFVAGIFRSVRFGASSAHGKANMIAFYYLQKKGAFSRSESGVYTVNKNEMDGAVDALVADILQIQGEGDYEKAKEWIASNSNIDEVLTKDLALISQSNIPRDIRFKQGHNVLKLK